MIYWMQYKDGNNTYTLAMTQKGLCFFGNDFPDEEAFKAWACKKGWTTLSSNEEKFTNALQQITAYFQKKRTKFDLPLDLQGTAFQQQVWQELLTVPYGEVISYSQLAEKIGRKEAVRAVANAVGKNPVFIIVPCHRIIGKNGKLTGFRGGLPLKQQLLALEDVII